MPDQGISIVDNSALTTLRVQHASHHHGTTVLLVADDSRPGRRQQAEFDSGADRFPSWRSSRRYHSRGRTTASDESHRVSPWPTAYFGSGCTGESRLRML